MVCVSFGLNVAVTAFIQFVSAEFIELDDVPIGIADEYGGKSAETSPPINFSRLPRGAGGG